MGDDWRMFMAAVQEKSFTGKVALVTCKRPITSAMLAEQWAAPPLISECGGILDATFSLSCHALYHAHHGSWVCDSPSRSEAVGYSRCEIVRADHSRSGSDSRAKAGAADRKIAASPGRDLVDQGKTCPRYSFAERRHGRGEDRVAPRARRVLRR